MGLTCVRRLDQEGGIGRDVVTQPKYAFFDALACGLMFSVIERDPADVTSLGGQGAGQLIV